MEAQELKNIWQAYDQKLEKSLALNLQCIEAIQTQKAKRKLNPLLFLKAFAVLAGIVWVWFLGSVAFAAAVAGYHDSFTVSKLFFIVSTGMIAAITIAAIVAYIRHMSLIWEINSTDNVVEMQEKTTLLQLSTLKAARVLSLQLPFYVTWFFRPEWISGGNLLFWLVYMPVLALFIFLSVWLYTNISVKNIGKKWFKMLFDSAEWTSPAKALQFLQEIEDFRKENP
ncbi:MAG: hypothetical protein MUD08_08200 [Cytophagales bacterium]|jgi:hypothetical protein|nr:hypothetical protein [Cytophagales bacterium]